MPYTHRADVAENRLYIRIAGCMDVKEAMEGVEVCLAEARKLKPGFDIITDISELKPGRDEVAVILAEAQRDIAKLNPGRVVRVIGKAAVANLLIQRTGKTAGYAAHSVGTLGEAEDFLAGS